ncbi:MAG: hypothetical protein AAGA15_03685 [Pseudomonadota bacterium]
MKVFSWLVAACAGMAALLAPPSASAQALDPCPRLLAADDARPGVIRMAWDWFSPSVEAPDVAYSDQPYYFTVNPGRFVNVRCDDQQFEEQEMYPIGLMVRPVAYVPLDAFEASRGDRAILVLTEYGQRKIIRESDIAPIVQNATYLFADTPLDAGVCRSAEDCPGNDLSVCEVRVQCRYVISARYGYAMVAGDDPLTQATIAAYRSLSKPLDLPPWLVDDELLRRRSRVEDQACQPIPVKAFKPGGALHQPRNSHFSLCARRRAAGAPSNAFTPAKIVTYERAAETFAWHLDGSFHRRLSVPRSGQDISLASTVAGYRLTSVKECGVQWTETNAASLPLGLRANISAGIVELSAGAETSVTTELTETLSDDDYILASTYFLEPLANAPGVAPTDEDDLWFFRVLFRSKCEDGTPKSATSIIIHYHRLAGQVLEVRASDDLRKSYLEAWAEYGYASDNSASALREGHFWIVPDLTGYFIWRDTLRKFIEVDNTVTSQLLDRHPPDQRAHVRDFFVHLMLAAAFNHRNPALRN